MFKELYLRRMNLIKVVLESELIKYNLNKEVPFISFEIPLFFRFDRMMIKIKVFNI